MARSDWLKVEPGDTLELTFVSATPKTEDGRYGQYHLYDVEEYDSQLMVSDFLRDLLEKADGFGDGALVEVSCTSKGKKRDYEVSVLEAGEANTVPEGDDDEDEDEDERPRRTSKRKGKLDSARKAVAKSSRKAPAQAASTRVFQDLVDDFTACLVASLDVCNAEIKDWTSEDRRAIATTLYIQGQREGVEFPKE